MRRTIRKTWTGFPIPIPDALELLSLAQERYGYDKARLAVLVCPVAVERVVDNAADATESLRRLRRRNRKESRVPPR